MWVWRTELYLQGKLSSDLAISHENAVTHKVAMLTTELIESLQF
jgi:hypothetical protein